MLFRIRNWLCRILGCGGAAEPLRGSSWYRKPGKDDKPGNGPKQSGSSWY